MAVLIGIALLLAQLASFAYVLTQRRQFNRAEIDAPAITRFTTTAADYAQAVPDFRSLVLTDASRRGSHYDLQDTSNVRNGLQRRDDTEDRLQQSLAAAGLKVTDVRAAIDPQPVEHHSPTDSHRSFQAILLSARLTDGHWLNARLFVPGQPPLVTPELVVATVLIYLFVLLASVLIALRLARPLRNLTEAAEAFRGRNQPLTVEAKGPADLRNAILAFNAMNERVVKLLEEKDRTLGAIGHDLRTPLASLRIRAESVEPEEERERMITTIEEMTATLEDILTLARTGRSREKFVRVDVSELARSIADEYAELGHPVTFWADGSHLLDVQPNLLRRAIRNLVDNALNYAGTAEVEVDGNSQEVMLSVLDRGPGIPAQDLERISSAFYRSEPSRNRDTGGAGLGLSIAEAVADTHGGKLTFANRPDGGFIAAIVIPTSG
ncbi:MAG TPA: HAMP domain-containing sensor histidine kinase [Sphingomicrobium sp.]|nr:HAMP domain-containing sensor histidine kinase [Sphingomicrobium sp.]